MAHTIEPAASGRATCRGCGKKIAKGELRLGERLPNPFADDKDMTIWFHLACGAYKRPEVFLEALEAHGDVDAPEPLVEEARRGVDHRRLPRVDGVERASTGRAKCRSCRESIAKGTWRIRLVFYEEGRFLPSGFIHAGCAREYLGTTDLLARAAHFGETWNEEDRPELEQALAGS